MQNLRTSLLASLTAFALLGLFAGIAPQGAQAQATAATAYRRFDLQVGGGFSYGKHDFEFATPGDGSRISGLSVYGTLDFKTHYGIEVAFHQLGNHKPDNLYERSYEIGPRYVLHFNRVNPYVRVMYGRGVFNYPFGAANLAYNMGVIAGGADINVLKHVNVRAEYEYQKWFSFPPHDLQPQMITVGAAYHF